MITESMGFLAQPLGVTWTESDTPQSDGFVGNNHSAMGQQILDVTETECESVAQPHRVADNFRRITETAVVVVLFHLNIITKSRST